MVFGDPEDAAEAARGFDGVELCGRGGGSHCRWRYLLRQKIVSSFGQRCEQFGLWWDVQ